MCCEPRYCHKDEQDAQISKAVVKGLAALCLLCSLAFPCMLNGLVAVLLMGRPAKPCKTGVSDPGQTPSGCTKGFFFANECDSLRPNTATRVNSLQKLITVVTASGKSADQS